MWFIVIVLLISAILKVNSREKENKTTEQEMSYRIVHPAEYLMR